MSQKQALRAFLLGYLILSLAACATGTSLTQPPPVPSRTSAPASTPQPTAATLPAGTLLYQADWSHGLSGWQGAQEWKVIQGQLGTDSSSPTTLTIPYRPTVTDYAIEIRMQIVRLLRNGGYFSISATNQPGKDGYEAGISKMLGPGPRPFGSHPQAQAWIIPYSSMSQGSGIPIDYEPDFQWHTYSVRVQGSEVRLLNDSMQIGYANSDNTGILSNGPLGLSSALLVLRVSSLRIIAL